MPILSSVDHAKHHIESVAVGPITYADVQEHILREKQWEGLPYGEFVEGRGAGVQLGPADIRKIVDLLRSLKDGSKLGPTAIVVSTEYAFGLMRMLEMLVEDVCEIRVFRDERVAREWLASRQV